MAGELLVVILSFDENATQKDRDVEVAVSSAVISNGTQNTARSFLKRNKFSLPISS